MFFEYRSKSFYPLVRKLSEQLHSGKNGSPLKSNWIVVQNREAREWITHQLARINGIAANIEFILPSELTWKLFRVIQTDLPKILPSDRLPMQWLIFELLGTKKKELVKAGFPFSLENENLRLQVASQIADVFDLYQMYRPEMIQSWTNQTLSTNNKHELWQSVLWNMLVEEWKTGSTELPNRGSAFFKLKEEINENTSLINYLPDQIHVFGLSQSSGPFLKLINTIAREKEVHFYTGVFDRPEDLNNSSIRELIQEWSESKIESLLILDEFKTKKTYLDSSEPNLLNKLTDRIPDNGIKVHSCHNVRREVEILKTELLGFLDQNPDVSVDEVLILVPEMEEYVSVIDSVFNFTEGEPLIPVGMPFLNNENISSLVINLLDMISSDFKVSSVIDLLESEPARTKFKLGIDDVSMVRYWLDEMNIHWGLEESDSGFSMEKAINSAFYGFVLEAPDFTVFNGTVPFGIINNTDRLNVLAKVSSYIECLKKVRAGIKQSQSAKAWLRSLREWVLELFAPEKSKALLIDFDKWLRSVEYSPNQSDISFSTFGEWAKEQLSDISAGSGRFGNGVQLSTYIPFRGLPFKHVSILGLNENVFPRNPVRPAFDLIHAEPKPGDRIMAKDDRLLFLEVLYSTGKKLHISYIGKDQYSENERLPSILVQKLVDALRNVDPLFEITEHKLHGFDQEIFAEPTVYSEHHRKISEVISSEEGVSRVFLTPEDFETLTFNEAEITLDDLISFFVHPCKYHAQNVLQISARTNGGVLNDRENFKLDGLSRYNVRQEIVSGIESNIDRSHLFDYLDVSGILPKGLPGDKLFNEQFSEITELVGIVSDYRTIDGSRLELDMVINQVQLYGRIEDIYGSSRIVFRAGSSRAKDLISLWINHLVCSVIDPDFKESIMVFKEKKNSKVITSIQKLNEVKNPLDILEGLVSWFTGSHSNKSGLCFFPESSLEYVSSEENHDTLEMWFGKDHGYSGDGNDFYNELYWRGTDPVHEQDFIDNSEQFWNPLLGLLTEVKPGE